MNDSSTFLVSDRKMHNVLAMFLVSLSNAVSGDLASLRRFAQGGPPPPGARQVAGGGLNRTPSSPSAATPEARPSVEVSGTPENRKDNGIFFPIPTGSKVIKHVELPKLSTVQSNATPLQTPEHSTLLKALGKSDPGFTATNSGSRDLESRMGLVRIPKNQAQGIDPLLAVPNAPRVQQTLPTQLESQSAQPDFAQIPQLQPSNPVPSSPPSRAQFQLDESLFADDNTDVLSDSPQLSDDELELEAALSMIKNNWDFVKAGGRLIISHREDDPIIISKDSIQRL